MKRVIFSVVVFVLLLGACAYKQPASTEGEPLPYASRYRALDSVATLLGGATVLTGTGELLDDADVLMRDGKIVAVGSELDAGDATSIDASEPEVFASQAEPKGSVAASESEGFAS